LTFGVGRHILPLLAIKNLKLFQSHDNRKEGELTMNNKHKRACWYLLLVGLSLCIFHVGCSTAPPPMTALHYDIPCSPEDARKHLRQYFSTQRIPTSEIAADNKSFTITTDLIKEPRSGKIDREITYKLEGKSTENANTSVIDLRRLTVRAKGARERDWYDDDIGAESQSEQQLAQEIQGICRAGQQ
jgi:hypothetical protein